MGRVTEGSTASTSARRSSTLPWMAAIVLVAAVSVAATWWMAVPRHGICLAIYPAPPGCADRTGAAVVATGVVVATFGLMVAAVWRFGRRLRGLPPVLVAVAALVAAVAYRGVLLS